MDAFYDGPDADEVDLQRVSGSGALNIDRPGGRSPDARTPDRIGIAAPLEGIPRLYQELLSRGDDYSQLGVRVEVIYVFILGETRDHS